MKSAIAMEEAGENVIHLEVGQPSTGAPRKVIEAAKNALDADRLGYTNAMGISQLRKRICQHYQSKYNVTISEERVVVTTGSSAGFLFAFLGCFDAGEIIGLCSSGYPCYRNDMMACGLQCASIQVNSDYKVTRKELEVEVKRRRELGLPPLSGFICSSPSNPTGVMLTPDELREICEFCEAERITFLSDEIYHGITYDGRKAETAAVYSKSAIVINSFSKYYSMTGWRLGWMVVPEGDLVDTMNRLSQNLFINAPTLSQIAAVQSFECEEELEHHVAKYRANRDVVVECLSALEIEHASPEGAFYVYCDASSYGVTDSLSLCQRILREAKVAITSGVDFEDPLSDLGGKRFRISYSRSTDEVREGCKRLEKWWRENMKKKEL